MRASVFRFLGLSMALIVLALAARESSQISFAQGQQQVPCPPTQPNTFCILTGHGRSVMSVNFSPDGRWLASSGDQTVKLWEVATGKELQTIRFGAYWDVYVATFSPDGQYLAFNSCGQLGSGPFNIPICIRGDVTLWDPTTGKEVRTLSGHALAVFAIAFSPDSKSLASGSNDKTIKLWEVATGKAVRTLLGHTNLVSAAAFSPDGRWLASGSWDRTVRLWDVATGSLVRTLDPYAGEVYTVAFSSDGKWLASGSDHIALWEVTSGREVRTLRDHTNSVTSVVFSPDGRLLASGSRDKTTKLWEVATGREVRTLSGHIWWVTSVAFSPDGRLLASSSCGQYDRQGLNCIGGEIRLWYVGDLTGR